MKWSEFVVAFAGGGLLGAAATGWLTRWTEREKPLREFMTGATRDFVDAVIAGILALINGDDAHREKRLAEAKRNCAKALRLLGQLHVLFHQKTYQQAEEAVVALRLAIRSGEQPASPTSLEPAYRHLRAFCDCAGAEIRRPAGVTRWFSAIRPLKGHIERQGFRAEDDQPPRSPLMASLDQPP